ncbi:MAG: hypothetical protein R2849_20980 [Thermomicrobiales bacterium]
MAVDSAVMVIDAAAASRPRPASSSDVCRQRNVPILIFVSKLDHRREPLSLLDEIEASWISGPSRSSGRSATVRPSRGSATSSGVGSCSSATPRPEARAGPDIDAGRPGRS